jgi:CRP-like cAMP-binding protein
MIQTFLDYLDGKIDLTPEESAFVAEQVSIATYKRGAFLLKEFEISKAFFFNLSGFVRLFYNQKGEERTAHFYPEGTFISAYQSFIKHTPSTFYLQATEETTVVVINRAAAAALLVFSPKFEILARIAMEEEMISYQEIIASLLTLNPEERYFHLLEKNPTIFQRVPQRQIASYIGVKPESLSRIKKRNFEKP